MMVRGWAGTGGILTPFHGWSDLTWSLSALVKMAPSTTIAYLIDGGLTPPAFIRATHSRTCSGRMSIMPMSPNSGKITIRKTYVYDCQVLDSISWLSSHVFST